MPINIKLVFAAIVLAIFAGLTASTIYYKNKYETKIAELASVSQLLRSTSNAADLCSQGVDQIVKDTEARVKAFQAEAVKVRKVADLHKRKAMDILEDKKAENESFCQASERLFNQYIQERNGETK